MLQTSAEHAKQTQVWGGQGEEEEAAEGAKAPQGWTIKLLKDRVGIAPEIGTRYCTVKSVRT